MSITLSVTDPAIELSRFDKNHYEQACDQAVAMCDGNLRNTVKALIMANEYLEAELEALHAAIMAGYIPESTRARMPSRSNAA